MPAKRKARSAAKPKAGAGQPPYRGWPKYVALFLALAVVLLIAYGPALKGLPVWDDDGHLTRPELQSLEGLARIWFKLGATQQYYPLTHTAFWVEQKLWGDAIAGYHVVNVLLHAAAAVLLAALLRRLMIPGAWVTAAIFALHPVHVESVAWISELKNTLSAVLYLGSAIAYLRFDASRKPAAYALALGLFLLALLSKTVTATLPAALLVILWWKRGRLSWKSDILPLAPWLILGVAAGLFTAWVERSYIGAEGQPYALSVLQRFALAGRVVWFYLGKLLWPADLMFVYPRWDLTAMRWWDWLYLPAALAALGAAWLARTRSRGPLAAALLFGGTLFPALGFFNVFPFLYSYVADHFQYLASAAVIALGAASGAVLIAWMPANGRRAAQAACGLFLVALGVLTWSQSRIYRDGETLYRATLAKNPDCWLAHNNLSGLLHNTNRLPEAMEHSLEALRLNPNNPAAQSNMALLLSATGEVDEALRYAREAVRLNPNRPDTRNNLGSILASKGDLPGARAEYAAAIRLDDDLALAHANLGRVDLLEGDLVAAAREVHAALKLDANNPPAHFTLAQLLHRQGNDQVALDHYRRALELQANWAGPLRDVKQIAETAADPALRRTAEDIFLRHAR